MDRVNDFATGKSVRDTPEERVRQEYERILVESYGYRRDDLDIEVRIPRGSGFFPDKADIVIYEGTGRDPAADVLGIVETKSPKVKSGKAQLKSYMTATSAEWGVWTNGSDIAYLYRDGTRIRDDYLNNIPARGQSVSDIGRIKKADLVPFGRSELKAVFRRILNTLYANTKIQRREKLGSEMMKLIFAKLKDETTYTDHPPAFRVEAGEDPRAVLERVRRLFGRVRQDLKKDGIFATHDDITLDAKSVAWVVGQLERGSLHRTDTDVVGDAFEVFSESKFIGEKGEFFTPRGVVRIAVKLADPKPRTTVCDPACGSGGFLIHAMKYAWEEMATDPEWVGVPNLKEQQRQLAQQMFFGIDKETDLVKIAKAHMAIAGDGRSNIIHENALHRPTDFTGRARSVFVRRGKFREYDLVLTNPPYGTKTKVLEEDAEGFVLGHRQLKWQNGRWSGHGNPVKRDPYVLFVERSLDMLKVGGTLGIVLPETVFHAPKRRKLREFILKGNSLRAVVSIPHNAFRPHCNAKTCLLLLTKGVPQRDTIIMADPEEMGHDMKGNRLNRPGTNELWDDLAVVLKELRTPANPKNRYTFEVGWQDVNPDILVPTYYKGMINPPEPPPGCDAVSLGDLVSHGVIRYWDGHGSPPSSEKGRGSVPYIRVKDIVNWEMYRNHLDGVTEEVWRRFTKGKATPEEGDIVFVRRGSYRIGTVAMASPRDGKLLLTRELLIIRVVKNHGWSSRINPFYLLMLLSSPFVQGQMKHLVFMDTTLPNIGDRWKDLILPVHKNSTDIKRHSSEVEKAIRNKWMAQSGIDDLRKQMGQLVT